MTCPVSQPAALLMPCWLPSVVCRLMERWYDAGTTALALKQSVWKGCLQRLPVQEAYRLTAALLIITEGLPAVALALRRQWAQAPGRRVAWPPAASNLAKFTSAGLDGVLCMVAEGLSSGSEAPSALARLLRSSTVRPELVVAALDALAQVVEPKADKGWAAPVVDTGGRESKSTLAHGCRHAAPAMQLPWYVAVHVRGWACTGRWL